MTWVFVSSRDCKIPFNVPASKLPTLTRERYSNGRRKPRAEIASRFLPREKNFRDNSARCELKPDASPAREKSLKSETRLTAPGTRDFRKHLSNLSTPFPPSSSLFRDAL